jgi:UDP-N-acetylmuramyl pentapeptide synthase
MKPLENLLARVEITRRSPLNANEDVRISQIEYDSRRVQPGTLFVAMKGGATDGNLYIEQALALTRCTLHEQHFQSWKSRKAVAPWLSSAALSMTTQIRSLV